MQPDTMNITNATISIWNSSYDLFNSTTNILTGESLNSTTWNISNFSLGQRYDWNVEACGTNSSADTNCYSKEYNFTFVSSAFSETDSTFNMSLFETSRQSFVLNITGNPGFSH